MSVSNSNMEWSITCTGVRLTDIVTLDAYLYNADDIEVILKLISDGSETLLVKTTDYTVSTLPSAAAVITTVDDYSALYQLYVRRVTDLKQTVDFVKGDPFPEGVVSKILDKQTMDQQVTNDDARRGIMVAKTSALRDLEVVPVASQVFGMNADNDGVIMYAPTASADADLADLIGAGFGVIIYPKSIQVGSANIKILSGAGSPEASIVASVGSIYMRTDGAADTSVYYKETGSGNTGWVARGVFAAPTIASYANGQHDHGDAAGGGILSIAGYILNFAPYSSDSFDFSSEDTASQATAFSSDGTKMYMVGSTNDKIYQYTLNTPWDINTATYDSIFISVAGEATSPVDLEISSNGTEMYILNNTSNVYQYTLSTPWDLSTGSYSGKSHDVTSEDAAPRGICFGDSGAKMYMIGATADDGYQYTLSTPWDISTASYDSKSASFNAEDTAPLDLCFNSNGTKLYMLGTANDTVYQYSLTTAWDISTASYASISFSVNSEEASPFGLTFSPNGTRMFVVGNTDSVFMYVTGCATVQ